MKPIDILAIGVHPDDIELCCAGTLIGEIAGGRSVGLVDLTRGELGTNGDAETRISESKRAQEIIGADWRVNLGMRDGFFQVNEEHILPIATVIRQARPKIILTNVISDRHPDHGRAAQLVYEAAFYSGLSKIKLTDDQGNDLERWRPQSLLHFIQDHYHKPDIVYNITPYFTKKVEAIAAYASQFSPVAGKELVSTPISDQLFWDFIEARGREMGRKIQCEYGEGFITRNPVYCENLFHLIQ